MNEIINKHVVVSNKNKISIRGAILKYNWDIHNRKSIRLKGYDYSKEGLYFITICTQNRECLFGEIINGKMILNNAGKMVEAIWFEIPKFYEGFVLHEFVIMPNHIHGIIEIIKNVGADSYICPNCNPTKIDNNLYQQGEYRDSPLQLVILWVHLNH